jgi:hypothetical protein
MTTMSILTLLLALAAQAPKADDAAKSPWEFHRFHRIHLRNGAFIDGHLLADEPREVTLQIKAGRFGVKRDMIDYVEFVTIRSLKPTPSAPVEAKAPAADAAEGAPMPAVAAAAPAPGSASTRGHVDRLLADWKESQEQVPYDLTPRLLALGPDAVSYACWLVANRVEGTPVREIIVAVSGTDHPSVYGALETVAGSGNADEQQAAVEALEFSSRSTSAELLIKFLGSPSAQVWRAASEALLRLHRKGVVTELTFQLAAKLDKAMEKAPYAITIAKIGDAEGRRALMDAARFTAPEQRAPILQGLAMYENPDDADLGLPLLTDREPQARRDACEFLGRIKALSTCPDLIDRLSDDDSAVVDAAHWALRKLSGERFGKDSDLWTRWWTATGSKLNGAQR